jgi:hypothetical protein
MNMKRRRVWMWIWIESKLDWNDQELRCPCIPTPYHLYCTYLQELHQLPISSSDNKNHPLFSMPLFLARKSLITWRGRIFLKSSTYILNNGRKSSSADPQETPKIQIADKFRNTFRSFGSRRWQLISCN